MKKGANMKLKCKQLFASLLVAAVAALPSIAHATNGMNQIGYGVKSKGMGGVGVALPQDSIVVAMNPAGMVHVGDRFDLECDWVGQDADAELRYGATGQEEVTSHDPLWFPEAGVNWMWRHDMSVGLSIYSAGSMKVNYENHFSPLGTTNARFEYTQLCISPSYAWQVTNIHALGIAVNFAIGWLDINGAENINTNSVRPRYFTNQGWEHAEGVSIRLGWLGKITKDLKLGFSYQTKTWMSKFRDYQGFLSHRGEFDLPAQWLLGAAWTPVDDWVFSIDLLRIQWTDSDTLEYSMREPGQEGGSGGPGFGWNDQNVVKIGVAWEATEHFTLRAGYNHGSQPIDHSETLRNALTQAVIEDHLTAGATWAWDENDVSIMYWHGFRHHANGINSDVGFGDVNLANSQNSIGLSYGRHY